MPPKRKSNQRRVSRQSAARAARALNRRTNSALSTTTRGGSSALRRKNSKRKASTSGSSARSARVLRRRTNSSTLIAEGGDRAGGASRSRKTNSVVRRGGGNASLPMLTENGVGIIRNGSISRGGVTVQVLAIYRYLIDNSFPARTNFNHVRNSGLLFAYDVVLSDGIFKTKCLLDPSQNSIVNVGELRKLSIVNVSQAEGFIDELTLGSEEQSKIMQIDVLNNSIDFPVKRSEGQLRYGPEGGNARVRSTIPLVKGQMFYLPFGNEDCMDLACEHLSEIPEAYKDSPWSNEDKTEIDGDQAVSLDCLSLANVIAFVSKGSLPGAINPPPPLVGRIVAKTRLLQLKTTHKKCPYYFMVDIFDESLSNPLRVVFWETLCPRFFNVLRPGQILRIKGYSYGKDRDGNLEFKLNPGKRNLRVDILNSGHFQPFLASSQESRRAICTRLPGVNYAFKQTKDIVVMERQPSVGANIFDLAGIVSYVGPVTRVRALGAERRGGTDEENSRFELYSVGENSNVSGLKDFSQDARMSERRWIKVRDGSSGVDLVILVYTNSQSYEFSKIQAGKFMAFTNLRLQTSSRVYRSFEPRSIWAVSTWKTRYVDEGGIGDKKPASRVPSTTEEICGSPYVRAVRTWWAATKQVYTVSNGRLIGPEEALYIPSRLRPSALSEYSASAENSINNSSQNGRQVYAPIVRFRDIGTILKSLHWSESRLLTIQAVFVSLSVAKLSTGEVSSDNMVLNVSDVNPGRSSALDIRYNANDDTCGIPFLPFGLEKRHRSGELPDFLAGMIAPFCSRGVLSQACCVALGKMSNGVSAQTALGKISKDLKGKRLLLHVVAEGVNRESIYLESAFVPPAVSL